MAVGLRPQLPYPCQAYDDWQPRGAQSWEQAAEQSDRECEQHSLRHERGRKRKTEHHLGKARAERGGGQTVEHEKGRDRS